VSISVNNNYNRTSPIRLRKVTADSSTNVKTSEVEEFMSDEDRQAQKEAEQFAHNQYRNFFGRGEFKFAFYPSYWKDSWGRAPLLGIVFADNEFLAERLAYDRGVLPSAFNCTFQPKIKNLGPGRNSK